MAQLKVTDASGRQAQHQLNSGTSCMIGRAPDNTIVLDDPRASRHHAHVRSVDDGSFTIVDGVVVNDQIKRSANKVFVNGEQKFEHLLKDGDRITIGASTLRFEQPKEERTADLSYDDKPLGHTQLLMSAKDVLTTVLRQADSSTAAGAPRDKVLESLQRKANILSELYEMSKALGSGFDLDRIFKMATDIIFRSTPADRVIALLAETLVTEQNADDAKLFPIATRARDEKLEAHARKMTIGRTITRKVMKDRVALLSQDAAADEQFAGVDSIVSQGVRSTICAPLFTEAGVHGALYADRLDPFSAFKPDDLELISAVAAQAAIAVENVRAHERLAKEEVARVNYSRFLP
jgi:adenylate cyclase